MPRKPRFFLPDTPVHMILRGNSRSVVFAESADYEAYLHWLTEGASSLKCQIHAYVLMSNHIHLLVSAAEPANLSRLSQHVGRKYVPYFNAKYQRSGTLWEGRFKASTIDSDQYLLTCLQYIELNPVRALMTEKPEDYRWSSYRTNAQQVKSKLVTPHPVYLALGKDNRQRAKNYRESFKEKLDDSLLKNIRASTQTGTPLGSDKFKRQVESLLAVKVGQPRRGRPSKNL